MERVFWSKPHPLGLVAKPFASPYGDLNLRKWRVGIPGRENTPWRYGFYRMYITFDALYPIYPPMCCFVRAPYHPNISNQGTFTLPLLTFGDGWHQDCRIETILLAIQDMIHAPDFSKPLQAEPYMQWYKNAFLFLELVEEDAWRTFYYRFIFDSSFF